MLGSGEVIGKLQTLWDELLDHGDEPFDLSFPPVRDVHPSLMLKAVVVHVCDDQDSALSDSLVDCKIARDTDAGHAQYAVEHFQLVLDQCPVRYPDHAAALTNLGWARLKGYIRNDLPDIDTIILGGEEELTPAPIPRSRTSSFISRLYTARPMPSSVPLEAQRHNLSSSILTFTLNFGEHIDVEFLREAPLDFLRPASRLLSVFHSSRSIPAASRPLNKSSSVVCLAGVERQRPNQSVPQISGGM
ncbi:hypothetical protein EV702DRAFT_1283237 [Suillus placidus]|uniref:Uncharacterized protein n=1 Tax=Suillus placidus TaxID=48579 RepID=A0A9P7CWS5_9AGAM|nr:hypothetical protein EV702DRAFT_1283237 [Suillus placidus]